MGSCGFVLMPVDLCKKCKTCKACGKKSYIESKIVVTGKLNPQREIIFMGWLYEPCGNEECW